METSLVQSQILQLEKQYWQAMTDHDVEAAISLTHFPCLVSGPQGTRQITEEQYRQMMAKDNGSQYKDVRIESSQVEVMNDQTAIITYATRVQGKKMLDTSLWIKDGEDWTCSYHSEFPDQSSMRM